MAKIDPRVADFGHLAGGARLACPHGTGPVTA